MDDNRKMQTLMSANTPTELMATRGRTFRDNAFKYFFNFVDDIKAGAGELAANRDFKTYVDTLEGQDLKDYDFSVSEQTRPLSQTEDFIMQNAPERYRNGGGVGSLNETARNMFRSYEDGGDVIPVPSGESTVITQSPTEYSFGDVFKEAGEEAFGDASERLSSAFRLDPEEQGGSGELVRRVADGLEDVGIAALLGLKGGSEKILALAAEVIDKGASKMFETQGPEKLYEDMVGGSEVAGAGGMGGILGLMGRGSRVTSKVKNAGGNMSVSTTKLKDFTEAEEIMRKANRLRDARRTTERDIDDTVSKKFKKPGSFMDDLINPSRLGSNFGDIQDMIKIQNIRSKFVEIEQHTANLLDMGFTPDEVLKEGDMLILVKQLKELGVESKAGGGMVGIGAYQNYMV